MVDKERESKKQSLGSVLGRFFIMIAIGGVFLSLGLIGVIKWMRRQPSPISIEMAIASLVIGIGLDGLAVRYFWQRRQDIFEQLK